MKKLLVYLKNYKKESVLAPLFKMLEATFELIVPLVVASIIDNGIKNGDLNLVIRKAGTLVLLAVVGYYCAIFRRKGGNGFCNRSAPLAF